VIALLIDEDIAAGAGGELRPAALKRPIGRRRGGRFDRNRGTPDVITCRLCHTRGEKKSEEN